MDTFCVLPWFSVELPSNSPCCLLPSNTDIDQVKKDLLSDVKSPACARCWAIESEGLKSKRQFENEFLDYKLDRDLELLKQDCSALSISPVLYQITTSNLCNQACVSCNSNASTKWAEIEKRMSMVPAKTFTIELEKQNVNYATARRISLLGGEPFFDSKTFEILENLVNNNNTDCAVSLVTNGSITLKDRHLELLSKFTDLNICISVDGVGPVFEYLRWPAKWSTLVNNIKFFQTITKNISISYTISSLNLFYYNQTINWFNEQGLKYNHNIVSVPNWLSPGSMPVELKQLLTDNLFAEQWINRTGNEISLQEFSDKISAQDTAKRINIKDYLPEISRLLNLP
jgi:sulfatase maturation enzyme AslB (radical SAM superfamily)